MISTGTFVLILTLFDSNGSYAQRNPSIEAVPGFTTQAACIEAGNRWLRQMNKFVYSHNNNSPSFIARAMCART